MAREESAELILFAGGLSAYNIDLLRAGSSARIEPLSGSLNEAIGAHTPNTLGIVIAPEDGVAAMKACHLSDGLARAVGSVDSIGFSRNLPGAYGFLALVGGIVEAVREAAGRRYIAGNAHIEAAGPLAWSALAALTQLRVTGIDAGGDPFSGAVAHRLGIELERINVADLVVSGDERGLTLTCDSFAVEPAQVALHTAAAQLRLFTSREPDVAEMRRVFHRHARRG